MQWKCPLQNDSHTVEATMCVMPPSFYVITCITKDEAYENMIGSDNSIVLNRQQAII